LVWCFEFSYSASNGAIAIVDLAKNEGVRAATTMADAAGIDIDSESVI